MAEVGCGLEPLWTVRDTSGKSRPEEAGAGAVAKVSNPAISLCFLKLLISSQWPR